MNKVIVYETSRKATFGNAGELSVKLTDGDWADVEDLKVAMDVPRIVGTLTPHYSYAGEELVMGGNGYRFPLGEYNITISGNLNGVFELTIGVKVLDNYDSEEVELSLPASGGAGGGGMLSVTHAELLALRNEGKLVPGQQYRITDYVATTTDPESASANHPFDIIVIADDVSVLNENARAVAHEGDTYFEKCNLAAWQLKYTIGNDMDRFTWADEDNGKGVIFEMIDENNNRAGYDFKGIVFKRYKITETSGTSTNLVGTYAGKGNDKLTLDENDFRLCYLFNVTFDDLNEDDSVGFYYGIPNNNNFKHNSTLLNGVFHISSQDGSPYGCTAGVNSYNWTCGNKCHSWTCGNKCHSWVCGFNSDSWKCGNNCYSWTCDNDCNAWTCENDCYSWTCGNNCDYWTCGNKCHSWKCKVGCSRWTCGDECYLWTCGQYCSSWVCGAGCHSWTCGDNCSSWVCGAGCYSWTCGSGCHGWTCGYSCYSWSCGDYCSYWNMASGGVGKINISTKFTQIANAKVPYHIGKDSQKAVVCKNLFD